MKNNTQLVNDYVLKIEEVENSLGSIGAPLDDDDLVLAILNDLNDEKWRLFSTFVYV